MEDLRCHVAILVSSGKSYVGMAVGLELYLNKYQYITCLARNSLI